MTEEGRKYLSDILIAINLIEQFTKDTPDFETYQADLKTQSAIERQLAIVGEALNKFRRTVPEVNIKHAQQIIAFRNRLVHAYDSIDNAIVWAILQNHLPKLKEEIAKK
ncbi:HepT-like ribonuclease domain-containing protein [Catalinimonas sp. 4WD22]|uniref:HepT-like ribonuclease domain-containing protein n=1 Tax=Catalinimonas locisalis TaxID=3133978 RepID=UPI003100C8F5